MSTTSERRYPPAQGLPRLAVAAIFRNEAPYVLEWLAHHRVVGVDFFYIADNASDDGTSELLQALHGLGYLQHIPFPSPAGQAPQLPAYTEILERYAVAEEWVAVIDADEFIVPDDESYDVRMCLHELSRRRPDAGAVALNWAIYGSSWLANHSSGLVTERFVRRAHLSFEPNLHYKTILRMAAFSGQIKNPHHFELKPGWRYVHTDGRCVEFHERHGPGLSRNVVWEGMRLNHYIVKSREEFITRKQPNGSAASLTRVKDDSYFRAYDRNDTRDPVATSLIRKVKDEMQRIERALAATGYRIAPPRDVEPIYVAPFRKTHGHIDSVRRVGDSIHVRGWAFDPTGAPAKRFTVKTGKTEITLDEYERISRPDVKRHYPMADANCGFHLVLQANLIEENADGIAVFAIDTSGELSGPFPGVDATLTS